MVEAAGQAAAELEPTADVDSGGTAKDPAEVDSVGGNFSLLDARGHTKSLQLSRPGPYKGKYGGKGVGGGSSGGGDGSDGGGGGSSGKRREGGSPMGLAALLDGFRLIASSPYLRLIAFFLVSQVNAFLGQDARSSEAYFCPLAVQLSFP